MVTIARPQSRLDYLLGGILALAMTIAAWALPYFAIIVVVPTVGLIALVASWRFKSRLLRGFAITIVGFTVMVVLVLFVPYVPYILGDIWGSIFG